MTRDGILRQLVSQAIGDLDELHAYMTAADASTERDLRLVAETIADTKKRLLLRRSIEVPQP